MSNRDPCSVHMWTFSPECASRWVLRCAPWLNDFSHCVHLCGFLPEWVRKWVLKWPARLNDLLHSAHLWGFSPLWVSRWVFRCAVRLNDVLYLVHLWAFSPEWVSSAHLMLCKAANLDVCMSPHKMRLASSLDRCRLASLTISAKWTFIQKICWFTHFCR